MEKEVFDNRIYDKLDDRAWWLRESFKDAIKQLQTEGLPTTLEFIQRITASEDALKDFINKEQQKRLSGGFVPIGERELVHQAFADMYERLQKKIAALRNALNGGLVIKADGDTVSIDEDAMEAKMKKDSTIEIDATKGEQYYQKFMAVVNDWQSLCEYEKTNHFPKIIRQLQFSDIIPFGIALDSRGTISENEFSFALRNWLKLKKK